MANIYSAAYNINELEQLSMGNSQIHNLHPMVKLVSTFIYIVFVISFPSNNISGLMPYFIYPLLLMAISDTPYKPLFKRLLIALPFSLFGGISNIIFINDKIYQIGNIYITFGMISFISIMLKTVLTVFGILILMSTTSFVDISNQLFILKVPKIICLVLSMTYRYLSLLISEGATMYTAYSLRSPNKNGVKMKDIGSFLGQLILRSFDHADNVYNAMKCRGFNGIYYGNSNQKFKVNDLIYFFSVILLIVFFRFFNFSLFLGNFFR